MGIFVSPQLQGRRFDDIDSVLGLSIQKLAAYQRLVENHKSEPLNDRAIRLAVLVKEF